VVEAFRFGLHCVPFRSHSCYVNQPKALAKLITSNIRVNRMTRPLEGSTLYGEEESLLVGDVEGAVHAMSSRDFCMFVHLVKS